MTHGLKVRCSTAELRAQVSGREFTAIITLLNGVIMIRAKSIFTMFTLPSTLSWIRTNDPALRRRMLYPTEL